MKKNINRNVLWADLFVEQLAKCGVRYVCLSPGSRSTPLTLAFAKHKKINKFVIIDERSSAFFALGLAKNTNRPVVIVTTSGTAAAELYPAIIEAYYQRAPLIICTGDRPPHLYNCGANQTINQIDLYNKHIRKFFNAGLPSITKSNLLKIKQLAAEAFFISLNVDRGPVHINFPFEKPFEPNSYTDKIDKEMLNKVSSLNLNKELSEKLKPIKYFNKVLQIINKTDKGIIFCGPGEYSNSFLLSLKKFSSVTKYPVFANSSSSARFTNNANIITNYNSFFRSKEFINKLDPKLIIQFGAAPATKSALDYFEKSKAEKILVNEFADLLDPSKSTKIILKTKPELFIKDFLKNGPPLRNNNKFLDKIKLLENNISKYKKAKIANATFPFEGRIIFDLLSIVPANSNLIISNSMPIRDLDYFAPSSPKRVKIFSNRGASGIDGITSTALGIAASSKNPTFLITGDLSFFHDMNGLLSAKLYKIPLIIILINNNGGAIFEMLPIAKYKNVFNQYFKTPHELNFEKFVNGYNGKFVNIKNWKLFKTEVRKALNLETFTVLHIKTDSIESHLFRKFYWNETLAITNNTLNEN